ncbi:MAG: M14 family zinc carboxypeptidase [bacterium]|nr:M14 family zinc carboxypeptidase [bacterium]
MKKILKQFGYIKRGILGFFQNNFDKLQNLSKKFGSFEIGKSIKEKPIQCFKIGNGPCKLLCVSGIHGNEIGTVKLAHCFLNWAHNNIDQFKNYTLFVVPCLNPDGYYLACKNPDYFNGGKIGRFNVNNVDLNRNFDTPSFTQKSIWSFGKNYKENVEVFCGNYGNSEPEIKALTELIKDKKIQIVFMFHNAGNDVMGNKNKLSQRLTKIYSEKTGFKYVSDEDWKELKQTGTAKEWCDLHDIAYVEVEGTTRWGSDWKKQKKAIKSIMSMNI